MESLRTNLRTYTHLSQEERAYLHDNRGTVSILESDGDFRRITTRESLIFSKIYRIDEYASGIWGGEPSSFKTCTNCAEIRSEVITFTKGDDNPAFGWLHEELTQWDDRPDLLERFKR